MVPPFPVNKQILSSTRHCMIAERGRQAAILTRRDRWRRFRYGGMTHLLEADPGSGCLTSPASACGSIAASHHSRLAEALKTLALL